MRRERKGKCLIGFLAAGCRGFCAERGEGFPDRRVCKEDEDPISICK